MSNIRIRRTHQLGLAGAKTQMQAIAEDLKQKLSADYVWRGDKLLFNRSGASGTIDVGEDYIELDIKLGMALSLMKGRIEDEINTKLDAAVRGQGGTTTA